MITKLLVHTSVCASASVVAQSLLLASREYCNCFHDKAMWAFAIILLSQQLKVGKLSFGYFCDDQVICIALYDLIKS